MSACSAATGDRRPARKYAPVVQDRKRFRLAGQHGVGDDDVGGQLSPGVEPGSADAVLAEHRQVEQVRR
jgi:hypothetical protein